MHKLWPTLVHVHIATEDHEALHPGATGLCYIIKVWLVTLIGLTNSQFFQLLRDDKKELHYTLGRAVEQFAVFLAVCLDKQAKVSSRGQSTTDMQSQPEE